MNNRMSQPADFERRILLTLAGHSPAIITETLYALTQQQAYVPTEIHVITTSSGQEKLISTLLGDNGVLTRFCNEYGVTMPKFTEAFIHVITDANGAVLHDLQTEADNEAAADFITQKVRELTRDENTSLHVSIAGGRKTMTYYLGYAMSVFGRIQDRMSHVLVDDRYAIPSFYYPTYTNCTITNTRNGDSFDAKDVVVTLGELPFIRLRDGLGFTRDLTDEKTDLSFNTVVRLVQNQFSGTSILLDNRGLFANNVPIRHKNFTATDIAVYAWLLYRRCIGAGSVNYKSKDDQPNQAYAEELLTIYRKLYGDRGIKKMEDAIEDKGMTADYLRTHISRCNKALDSSFSRREVADKYIIHTTTTDGHVIYDLSDELLPEHISLPFSLA